MSSETTLVAERCHLQEWAAQIRDCQSRPAGMSVVSWCACHGITKANYYYRLRCVREACIENMRGEILPQQIVLIDPGFLQMNDKNSSNTQPEVDIYIKGGSIHVTEFASMSLLEKVLKAVRHEGAGHAAAERL